MSELDEEKRFYERFWALLSNRDLMRVFERYGPAAFRRSSVLEGFERFLQSSGMRGKCCVEIGSLKGLTAVVLAKRFEHVISIDIHEDPDKHRVVQMLGAHNITFWTVLDNAEKAKVIQGLQFDAAYVDGDHIRDTQSDFDLVRRCGRVLFHEYWSAQPAVVKLVDSLRSHGKVRVEGKLALWTA